MSVVIIFFYCRIEQLTKQYTELEDEFRMALQIEASRFNEVMFNAFKICIKALINSHRFNDNCHKRLIWFYGPSWS